MLRYFAAATLRWPRSLRSSNGPPALVLQSPGGPPLAGVRALTGPSGGHHCALLEGGELRCWGANGSGQLGDGTKTSRPHPVPVVQSAGGPPLTGVVAVSVNNANSCAVLANGEARCWGNNQYGQLGDGTFGAFGGGVAVPSPVLLSVGGPPLTGVQAVGVGFGHACALVGGGEVRCWGYNLTGQMGNGTTQSQEPIGTPGPVTVLQAVGGLPLTGVQSLVVGGNHTCALLGGDDVRCWGEGDYGQLGHGAKGSRSTPVRVLQSAGGPPLAGVQALALGSFHSCARLAGGEVRCWGENLDGQIGDGTTTNCLAPVPVLASVGGPPLAGVLAVAVGGRSNCVWRGGSDVRCWGENFSGQLGDGTTIHRPTPVSVVFP